TDCRRPRRRAARRSQSVAGADRRLASSPPHSTRPVVAQRGPAGGQARANGPGAHRTRYCGAASALGARLDVAQSPPSYLNDTLTLALYALTCPSSICRSSSETSAIRRSRNDLAAWDTATLAAFSQDSSLVPTSSMTLYTLS